MQNGESSADSLKDVELGCPYLLHMRCAWRGSRYESPEHVISIVYRVIGWGVPFGTLDLRY